MKDLANIRTAAAAEICQKLQTALSDTAVETAKLQLFHYNVKGMQFMQFHEMFEEMYRDHFEAQDDLAERIKALGGHVENRLAKHLEHAKLKEHDGHKSAKEMVEILTKDQEHLAVTMKDLAEFADQKGDGVTHDLCIARAELHDERAWMLRAHLE